MCGRYENKQAQATIIRKDGTIKTFLMRPRFNIAPVQLAPVVMLDDGEPQMVEKHWGFVPKWKGGPLINARADGIEEKHSFRDAILRRRCLIPAHGFFEWQTVGDEKLPWHFTRKDDASFFFAGIWEQFPKDPKPDRYCIITVEPNGLLEKYHNRMPAMLAPEQHWAWLDPSGEAWRDVLKPFPAGEMTARRVSPLVNSWKNESPDVLKPIEVQSGLL